MRPGADDATTYYDETTTTKEHEQLLERVVSLEGHERRIGRIEHHLDTLPFPLRLPPEERTGR